MSASELEQSSIRYTYRERIFHLDKASAGLWTVYDEGRADLGKLVRVAPEGEEHEPVFGIIFPGETGTALEGSDWRGLVAALINTSIDPTPSWGGGQGAA